MDEKKQDGFVAEESESRKRKRKNPWLVVLIVLLCLLLVLGAVVGGGYWWIHHTVDTNINSSDSYTDDEVDANDKDDIVDDIVDANPDVDPDEVDDKMMPVIHQTVRACEEMSKERIGALIVFARDSMMDEYYKTGTVIDAAASEQLIRNIFFPKAALHDGAMIIQDGRIHAAGCVLPLSDSIRLSADLGTRHRAAVGMSEVTDAVVVVVSEETGVISVAVGGMLKRHLAPQTLERLLRTELCHEEKRENKKLNLLQKFQKKDKGGA